MKKRGQIEITADILALCTKAKNKTRIMYKTNLSYTQLKTYIVLLTAKNLLKQISQSYVTTDKGYRFLEAFAGLNGILEERASNTSIFAAQTHFEELEIIQRRQMETPEDSRKILIPVKNK